MYTKNYTVKQQKIEAATFLVRGQGVKVSQATAFKIQGKGKEPPRYFFFKFKKKNIKNTTLKEHFSPGGFFSLFPKKTKPLLRTEGHRIATKCIHFYPSRKTLVTTAGMLYFDPIPFYRLQGNNYILPNTYRYRC